MMLEPSRTFLSVSDFEVFGASRDEFEERDSPSHLDKGVSNCSAYQNFSFFGHRTRDE